jgi:hypothetical protein
VGYRVRLRANQPRRANYLRSERLPLKAWRRGSGSNRRIKVLQTSPLPLGYRALATCAAGLEGLRKERPEPASANLDAGQIAAVMETEPAIWSGRRDLNPRPSPWQGDALPLSYSR